MAIDRTQYRKGMDLIGGDFPADVVAGGKPVTETVTETVTEIPRRPPEPKWDEYAERLERFRKQFEALAAQVRRR